MDDETTRDSHASAETRKRRCFDSGGYQAAAGDEMEQDPQEGGNAGQTEADKEAEEIPPVTEEQEEIIKGKLPQFEALLSDLSRQQHGASILDVDLVTQAAEDKLKLHRSEIYMLIALLQRKETVCLHNNSLYFL